MINISKLLFGQFTIEKDLRYGKNCHQKPVVVWNITRRCNLRCIHCYSDSGDRKYSGELTTQEAKQFIKDIAEFKVPVLIFSGGEALLRDDIFDLIETAKKYKLRVVLSTNGTLITQKIAKKMRNVNIDYVGISIDGLGETNDRLRGKKGAFKKTLEGIYNCQNTELKVGVRFTITRHNFKEIPSLFDLIEKEEISRVCFYHLVYSGRGCNMKKDDLSHADKRKVVDYIITKATEFQRKGLKKDILTVDNHTDGVYLYLKLLKENPERAVKTLELLKRNSGNSSGIGIAGVDNLGNVHPDQFWQDDSVGNVKITPFSKIWHDENSPILKDLRNRKQLLKGKCSKCRFLDICNGNFRIRAKQVYGDIWQEDPACYLRDEEICTTLHQD